MTPAKIMTSSSRSPFSLVKDEHVHKTGDSKEKNADTSGVASSSSPGTPPSSFMNRRRHLEAAMARFSPANFNRDHHPPHPPSQHHRRRPSLTPASSPQKSRLAAKKGGGRVNSLRKSLPSLFKDAPLLISSAGSEEMKTAPVPAELNNTGVARTDADVA